MEKKPEYVSLGILKLHYADWKLYLRAHKLGLISVFCIFFALSITASFFIAPKYTANLSFAMQSESGSSGIADLASSIGLNLGGGSSGTFSGDNIFELLVSRLMVEKALLRTDTIDGKKTNLLNLYLDVYHFRDMWKKAKENSPLRKLSFPLDQSRETYSREQDSVFQMISTMIITKQLSVQKRSKKLSFGDISFVSTNEKLSKHFVENLMKEASAFYIDTKTKQTRENYLHIQHQTDSVKRAYIAALGARASAIDVIPNAIRQTSSVNALQKTTEVQLLATTYAELKKNLELARLSMQSDTPIIEVIDAPRYPLLRTRFGLIKATAVGIVGGAFFALFIYSFSFVRKLRRNNKEKGIMPVPIEGV